MDVRSDYVMINLYDTEVTSAMAAANTTTTTDVTVEVNGQRYTVENADPKTSLNDWLRSQPGLKGTKVTCKEGGCCACVVALTRPDPISGQEKTFAINSCLFPLYATDGLKITTTEGLGSSRTGYHPIQERIAEYNGSQCGYCTPGMVMNMYSFLSGNPQPTKQEIEDGLDGHICRCTGFRPILDAMKSFAKDANPIDIEDLHKCQKKGGCDKSNGKFCQITRFEKDQVFDSTWQKPATLSDLYSIFTSAKAASKTVRMIVGNTGKGVYKQDDNADIYIGITNIPELNTVKLTSSSLQLGAALSLNTVVEQLTANSGKSKSFKVLADHIKKIANTSVRNVGCWAGNLMLIHKHREFPSDFYTIMDTVGATLTIGETNKTTATYSLADFLNLQMDQKVILSIDIPFLASGEQIKTFKIMPRHQSAHAYVNAGFRAAVDANLTIQGTPSLVFGGVKLSPMRASKTEKFLSGKRLVDQNTLQACLNVLNNEVQPQSLPVMASAEYRKNLVMALFYKFYLFVLGDKASSRVRSAAVDFVRPISSGIQSFDTIKSEYPLTKPMPKMAAKYQASGEARYTDDIAQQQGEAYGAFVTTTKGNCKLAKVDPTAALSMPGVLKFIKASDIPGDNNFTPLLGEKEEIFCSGDVNYAGQAVGVIIAETQILADEAATKVSVSYSDEKPPIISVQDAIKASSFFPDQSQEMTAGDPDKAMASSAHVITGEISLGTQHHFHMETHICLCIPGEEEMMVHTATQWISNVHMAIAQALRMPLKSIKVETRRCGGGFGGKLARNSQNSAACAVAASIMNRPVRMRMNLHTNMAMCGKRFPYVAQYKVGVTEAGLLNAVEITYYAGCGSSTNEQSLSLIMMFADNTYSCPNWKLRCVPCKTNTATSAWTRAPGTFPSIFITETMMNHVAKTLNKTPEEFKQMNFYKKGQTTFYKQPLPYFNVPAMWKEMMTSSEYDKQRTEIEEFNKVNRWRKRGISMMPIKYGLSYDNSRFTAYIAVYPEDGTMKIVHGGVEIGQGINTKVCQVAAYTLGYDLDVGQMSVEPASSFMNPSGGGTGGSITSELCCKAVMGCCNILKERLSPIAEEMENPTWKTLVQKAFSEGVDLSVKYMLYATHEHPYVYNIYGAACTTVEVDVLTGETEILRADVLHDGGISLNPDVDVGQIEGAFVMGIGYWLTEKAIYDPTTGLELTNNTWEYYPPLSKDIPIDFRVYLEKNTPNPLGVLRSKAVGEPPQLLSSSVLFAVHDAIYNAREEIGKDKDYFALDGPSTVEVTQLKCLVDYEQFLV